MPNRHFYPPVDPGYGAIGQALGQGLVGGVQGYMGGREQQRQNAIRQAMMQQQAEQAAAQQAHNTGMLDINRERLGLAQTQATRDAASRGFFPDPETAMAAGGGVGMTEVQPVQVGDEFKMPGFQDAARAHYRPEGQSQGSIVQALASRVWQDVTGGSGSALNREAHMPAVTRAAEPYAQEFGVPVGAIASAVFGAFGGERAEPRDRTDPAERRQRALVRAAQNVVGQFEERSPAAIYNPAAPETQRQRWENWLNSAGGSTAISRAAAEAAAEAGIELSPQEVQALVEHLIQLQEQDPQAQAPQTEEGGGFGAVLRGLLGWD